MDANEYQKLAGETESNLPEDEILSRMNPRFLKLLHCGIGICTEAGELQDVLKKHLYYGKSLGPAEIRNLAEELGDVLWYVALGCSALNMNMGLVMEDNIAKLKARYPEKFTSHHALNRNLENEMKAMEDG